MKFIKNNRISVDYFDAHKFRGKNFFFNFQNDDLKNLKKFKKFLVKKNIPCRVCNSILIDNYFLKVSEKYYLRKCKKCEFIFPNIDCLKIQNYSEKIYSEYNLTNLSKDSSKFTKYRDIKLVKERFNYCYKKNFKNNSKKVLEIGFGEGNFLRYLRQKGIYYEGFEFSKNLFIKAKRNKLNVSFGDIFNLKDNSFDLVVMFDVIEHLVDPVKTVNKIYKILKKKGLLIFYTPHINSLGFELMGKHQNLIQPFYHLNFFSNKNIKLLALKNNFKILKFETKGLDLIDFFLMHEFKDKENYTKTFKTEISIIQSIIDYSGYANHLRLTFQK
jgi:SAM-dependent methyltransferase